jgi:outer membrane protein
MNQTLHRHAVTLVAALLLASFSPSVFAQVRIAVVDMQRALNETQDGRRAKAQLKRLFKRRQQALDAKQNELKKMKESIEKQKNVLSRDALQKRLEEYQQAFVELQTTYVEYQRELAQKEAQLTKGILERMQGILRRIGQSENYTMIVERNEGGVVWAPSSLDITDDLIQRYNAGEGRGGGGASKRR